MLKWVKYIVVGLVLSSVHWVAAQGVRDTLRYDFYYKTILENHPLVQQANLKSQLAEANWLEAKGYFDPILASSWSQKNFDDKLYYQYFNAQLDIPTRLGLNVVAGYENTEGVFLNPENKTDAFGLWNLGLEANLLQGLLIDERRVKLRQASVFEQIAENQRLILLNQVLYTGTLAYIEWQQFYEAQTTIQASIQVAQTYLENTKTSFLNGEKTAVDTLEARLIMQDRMALLQKNATKLVKARQQVENFWWQNQQTQSLPDGLRPEPFMDLVEDFEKDMAFDPKLIEENPSILEKKNKETYYQIGQRWKEEKRKPKLKAKFNPLLGTNTEGIQPTFSLNNYKWGVDFSYPLWTRRERAAIQKGEIKILEIQNDIANKSNVLQNKIEASLLQQELLRDNIALQQRNIGGYEQLLEAENEKFNFGESSVFLLNKRQEKLIDGQLKLIQLQAKLRKEQALYLYLINGLVLE